MNVKEFPQFPINDKNLTEMSSAALVPPAKYGWYLLYLFPEEVVGIGGAL